VVAHSQLRGLGLSPKAIRHRLSNGRLHRLTKGVYAVGRPEVGLQGRWMAAALACGPEALLSHSSAAALWGIRRPAPGPVEVVVPPHVARRRQGIRVHRLTAPAGALALGERADEGRAARWQRYRQSVEGIPVTSPIVTLVDLASYLPIGDLEASVNEADHLDLVDPEALRAGIDQLPLRPGGRRLRILLDTASKVLTTTELERRFLPLVREAGLPLPQTQEQIGSNRVDFFWPELGLVVETDSLRYHRTAFKQASDKRRDNANARRGLVTLRFSHGQVRYEPQYVRAELRAVAALLAEASSKRNRPHRGA
jgi:very-short-patch-repair endonuclease